MKLSQEEKNKRKLARKMDKFISKRKAQIESEKNQPEVESIVITIEWKKSRTWGANPHAIANVKFKSDPIGHTKKGGYTASGCGYDKESTVVAAIFNDFLKYELWKYSLKELKRNDYDWKEKGGAPYGISSYKYQVLDYEYETRYFDGGIGIDCYYAISEFLGGKFEIVANGESFSVYKYSKL